MGLEWGGVKGGAGGGAKGSSSSLHLLHPPARWGLFLPPSRLSLGCVWAAQVKLPQAKGLSSHPPLAAQSGPPVGGGGAVSAPPSDWEHQESGPCSPQGCWDCLLLADLLLAASSAHRAWAVSPVGDTLGPGPRQCLWALPLLQPLWLGALRPWLGAEGSAPRPALPLLTGAPWR